MNKKFSTLVAGLLLAGSLPVAAQYCPQAGEVAYRTRMVKAATLDEHFKGVKEIVAGYQYQLQVNPESLGQKKGEFVLTVERDYSTGKLYLTAQEITKATLTHSLWEIKVTDRSVNGRVYTYVNKETGFELAFDHANALQRKDGKVERTDEVNAEWNYEDNGLLSGCTDHWAWYTTEDNGSTKLDYKKIYSYFHNGTDSVMALRVLKGANNDFADYDYRPATALSVDGLDGSANGGWAVVAVKESKEKAKDFISNIANVLEIRPVVAGAKVLNADEINTMIDADGSYLDFPGHIANYGHSWDNATNGKRGEFAKFTVLNPVDGKPLNIVEEANPFIHAFKENKFVAEYGYKVLNRNSYSADNKGLDGSKANAFAGYDILLRTSDPVKTIGSDKIYNYLFVHEHNYENTPGGNYNGLKVVAQPYASMTGELGTATASREYKKGTNVVANKAGVPDALEARYHWKATYYATNDSLVLEPLNASRMNEVEMEAEEAFEKTHLATAWSHQWVNTVNAAVAYNGTNEEDNGANDGSSVLQGNSMYNKAAGVPVALYAMNNSLVGDKDWLLTVGSGATSGVNASDVKWAAVCKGEGNPAYVTNKSKEDKYQAAMNLKLEFDNAYTHLERATVASGLYFMNIVDVKAATGQTEHRVENAYIVEDMEGHVVYDIEEEGQQDFTHMPATQWVVEQQPCVEGDEVNFNENPTVKIWNREFNGLSSFSRPAFEGQLYTKGDGKMFTINHREYRMYPIRQDVDHHWRRQLNCADVIKFTAVDPQTTLGYFNASDDELRNQVYKFQHMYDMVTAKFLQVADNNLLKLGDEGTEFELFRSEGWIPVADSALVYDETTNTEELKPTGTFHFDYLDEQPYGYSSEIAKVAPLTRTFYKIKVKDANHIDNGHTFVAIDNEHYYVVATEDEIADPTNHLTFAIVTLKENNHLEEGHGYAIVNAPAYMKVKADATESDMVKLHKTEIDLYQENGLYEITEIYYKEVDGEEGYNKDKDVAYVERLKNTRQVLGKMAIESISLEAKIADLCETTTDAFVLVSGDNKRYRDLAETEYAEVVNNDKKVIDLITVDEQSAQSLFEDSHSDKAQLNKLNYLACENHPNTTNREGFYVDKVAKSKATMPQYLFVVAADSIPAYTYCDCAEHDVKHGINSGCAHSEEYAGYVSGRFMINFNDSIQNLIDKLDLKNVDKFRDNNKTRLGFVEAVHRGDSLYVLKAPYTLASIKEESKDGSGQIINPLFLSEDSLGVVYDIVKLDGKHNNVAFSLRNTGDEYDSFLIESNDDLYSQEGSFAGAWVKIENGVPVLTFHKNVNGNHNTGDSTDAWKEMNDWTTIANEGELINQAARFTFKAIDKDASATANEDIATSDIQVVGVKGAVIVKGAAGKAVAINNILGQTVATATIASDNETIDVPAGIVVVSVEGEEAAKVVVK